MSHFNLSWEVAASVLSIIKICGVLFRNIYFAVYFWWSNCLVQKKNLTNRFKILHKVRGFNGFVQGTVVFKLKTALKNPLR